MIILNLEQGSPEWLRIRKKHNTASEASIMMACSPNVTRNELLHMKATGSDREFSDWFQKNILDKGHEVEALARPLAEAIIGEDLYPITALDDSENLLASFDGVTLLEDVIWECKQWNKEKAEAVDSGKVPECDYWQVVQQLAVSGAERCLYMVTDGTEENCVHVWATLSPEDHIRLDAGWAQFDEDRENYQPPEDAKPAAVGKTPENLPALRIEVTGMVKASNLQEFKDHALTVLDGINRDLQTDEDFATAEATVKWCKGVEDRLKAAKDQALSQTADIYEVLQTLDYVSEESRKIRLALDKDVKAQKQQRKDEILRNARAAFDEHIRKLNENLGQGFLSASAGTVPDADFAGAMKGKRTIETLQSAADDELARAKIEASQVADLIRGNLAQIDEHASDYRFLFNDLQQIVTKPADDFAALVKMRISEHKEAEEKRLAAEREQIRKQEEEKARREAEQASAAKKTLTPPSQQEQVAEARRQSEELYGDGQGRENQEGPAEVPRNLDELGASSPRSFQMQLSDWQQAHGISDEAMADLWKILSAKAAA